VLVTSIPTVLILAQQWARRSRKRQGSVACTEQGDGSGAIRSKPAVRVSHVWLGCISKDETQRGVSTPRCHTMANVASRSLRRNHVLSADNQQDRRAPNDGVNGVESRPNHDATWLCVNAGSSTLVGAVNPNLHDDGVPVILNGWPVMGSATGIKTGRGARYKLSVMAAKVWLAGGKGNSFSIQSTARKEDC
jgi:hypothetical protein